jgi:methylglyoxal/glyoxal reductase
VVIPKSARRERIVENADVFDFQLTAADLQALDGLSRSR